MIERYRNWYEHERACNEKMLEMIESVPEDRRDDPRFGRAVDLAAHLAACRENWMVRMKGTGQAGDWWRENVQLETLRPRFARVESEWAEYLKSLSDDDIAKDFEFSAGGARYRWNIEGQIVQLVGHAFYHRGQIAQLVDGLDGKTVDTDYLFWAIEREPRYGKIAS